MDNTELIHVEIVLKEMALVGAMESALGAVERKHVYLKMTLVMVCTNG